MIQVSVNQLNNSVPKYLKFAETQDVIIMRQGVPAGMLVGFSNADDWWEELLLRHPRFQARIAKARRSLREGRGRTIEQLREKYTMNTSSQLT
ncbi:MAG: prevent-host-death protein [Chloroflexota bacterium]